MRDIYARLLRRFASPRDYPVLDLGCGSGGNLPVLSPYGPVVGVDLATVALELWQTEAYGLIQASAGALPFADNSFGLVTLLGLIEHVPDDVLVLREVSRVCRMDGVLLVNTSAFMLLWSQHDEANRHTRRYLARDLKKRSAEGGLRVLKITYANTFLFPVALVVRLVQRFTRNRSSQAPRVDMFPVREPLNTWLTLMLSLEGWLVEHVDLPFGVSLLAVLKPAYGKDSA